MSHILVVDLEATCWEGEEPKQTVQTMEIVEFGCVVTTPGGEIVHAFSQLARPAERPELTDTFFRVTKTITQAMLNAAPSYPEAVAVVDEKLRNYDISHWISWGNYDRDQLESMALRTRSQPEFLQRPHLNYREVYREHKGSRRNAHVHGALAHFGMQWEGQQHRALPDAYNVARLVQHLGLGSVADRD